MNEQPLKTYRDKRDFRESPEPKGRHRRATGHVYAIQKHAARRLHYDLRLELDGVLKSWAVPKGPSLDPRDKRLAVRVEDHPVEYGNFEGMIPKGYGAGAVMLWDRGKWRAQGDPRKGLASGTLKFTLDGERLKGGFALVRMKADRKGGRENWLLIKERDEFADPDADPTALWDRSVQSDRSLRAIRSEPDHGRGKKPSKLRFIAPQLASLRDEPPSGKDWIHELKYDGYRIQAHVTAGTVRLLTRNGKDWTERYAPVAEALARLGADEAILDGELVALDETGTSRFGLLQNATSGNAAELVYYAFDLLHLDGKKLIGQPLLERKAQLQSLLPKKQRTIRYSDHIEGRGDRVIRKACALGLEGIVSKKKSARYRSGRATSWIKSKCVGNDEYVVVGFRRSDKRGRAFSSLLLGEYVGDELIYRGRVGTGFDERTLRSLGETLKSLQRRKSPLTDTPGDAQSRAVWVEPQLVAQIAYTELTADGRLRHPRFLGLREDKPAKEVKSVTPSKKGKPLEIMGVRLTSPEKIMYPAQGATKQAIAEYYRRNAANVLQYLQGRPLSLVRCPSGRAGNCFFQRHHTASVPDELEAIEIREKDGERAPYLVVRSAAGLIAATQIGALELHIWGSRDDRIERPERIVFDLDPDEDLPFARVRDAARQMRDILDAAGLRSFALLTGGKGIHVVVPVVRRVGWEETKAFSQGLARRLATAAPQDYVAVASKARRKGKIFIDWLRNERGATAIAPYSLRSRPGAPIATPVAWEELTRIERADQYTLDNINRRLSGLRTDPWEGYSTARQSLTKSLLESIAGS